MIIPTIKVKTKDSYMIINECDFVDGVHVRFGESAPIKESVAIEERPAKKAKAVKGKS
jgi:hypothetical protein